MSKFKNMTPRYETSFDLDGGTYHDRNENLLTQFYLDHVIFHTIKSKSIHIVTNFRCVVPYFHSKLLKRCNFFIKIFIFMGMD